jgi:uncharacterized protein involved in type VI secretion and phage assembly
MNIVITGAVSDNQDPDSYGRVKLSLYLSDEATESDWIPVLQSFAGDDKGVFNLPEIGDYVLAVFTDQSYRKGYVLGSIWPQGTTLPSSVENTAADFNADGNNALRMIKSKTGQRVILDDTDGAEKIQILNTDGTARIELDVAAETINIETDTDVTLNAATTVNISADEMIIDLTGDLTISCDNFGLDAGGDSTISASGSIAMDGTSIGLN